MSLPGTQLAHKVPLLASPFALGRWWKATSSAPAQDNRGGVGRPLLFSVATWRGTWTRGRWRKGPPFAGQSRGEAEGSGGGAAQPLRCHPASMRTDGEGAPRAQVGTKVETGLGKWARGWRDQQTGLCELQQKQGLSPLGGGESSGGASEGARPSG